MKQKTSKSRFTRALERMKAWCRKNRHLSIAEQYKTLCQKLKGHFGYFGITGNFKAI